MHYRSYVSSGIEFDSGDLNFDFHIWDIQMNHDTWIVEWLQLEVHNHVMVANDKESYRQFVNLVLSCSAWINGLTKELWSYVTVHKARLTEPPRELVDHVFVLAILLSMEPGIV